MVNLAKKTNFKSPQKIALKTPTKTLSRTSLRKAIQSKHANTLIKVIFSVLLLCTIYRQVFAQADLALISEAFLHNFTFPHLNWLLFVFLLVPVNWGLEALKWRQLIKNFTLLSFWNIFKAILSGVAVSLLTPNRIGEYGGRILQIEARHNWKAVIATMVGSFSQLLVLLSAGLFGAVWFSYQYLQLELYILQIVLFFGIVLIGLLLFGFFNIDLIVPIAKRIPFAEKFHRYLRPLNVLRNYTAKELSIALLFAFLRYATYSLQYYFVLQFFGIEVTIVEGVSGISTLFLLQTSIPLPPLLGLLARGEMALFVWGSFSADEVGILASSFSLFVINLILPALVGMVFIVQINVLKSLGYENGKRN